ncbi:MAG: antitoxin family protein [Chloroflexota bacterium]|nr:antitoxin family protein [Chloroflexota bacterium]
MPKKINIRAVYKNGALTPLSHVDIPDGDVVSLTIEVEEKI